MSCVSFQICGVMVCDVWGTENETEREEIFFSSAMEEAIHENHGRSDVIDTASRTWRTDNRSHLPTTHGKNNTINIKYITIDKHKINFAFHGRCIKQGDRHISVGERDTPSICFFWQTTPVLCVDTTASSILSI
eukprot:TRINITY_DN532_c0_g1_i7.p1 TRINITY_DN532_c0_g1~~TRINITY_DN532_c0_g1_i7.p1  ORF type:complete len:134 (+),score=3.71 TRINITY_DN532_c0_g1_i7:600-1001(+)